MFLELIFRKKTLAFFLFFFLTFTKPTEVLAVLYDASGILGQFGPNGAPNYTTSGSNGGPTAQNLSYASDQAIDSGNHRLFVSDSNNNRILVFSLDATNRLATNTASYVLGQPDFTSGNSHLTQSGLYNPRGLAYDSENERLFVADSINNRVMVFDVNPATIQNGANAVNVLGQPDYTTPGAHIVYAEPLDDPTTRNTLIYPVDVEYDSVNDRLYVSETTNNRVLTFNVNPATIQNGMNAEHVLGQPDFTSALSATTRNRFRGGRNDNGNFWGGPTGLTLDSVNHRLMVVEISYGSRVLVFDVSTITDGEDATVILGGFNNWVPTASTLSLPEGTAYDPDTSRLFVADTQGSRVLVFDAAVGVLSDGDLAINVIGEPNFTSGPNFTSVSQSQMPYPGGLLYETVSKQLWVADYFNSRIMIFDAESPLTDGPNAVDELGQYDANGNDSYTKGASNNGPTNSGLDYPSALALDTKNHRLFVTDSYNNRVLVFLLDVNNNISNTTVSYVLGQSDFVSSGTGLTADTIYFPYGGLAYDSVNERLFVADSFNNRVLVFNVNPSTITNGENADFVLGQPDFTTNTESGNHSLTSRSVIDGGVPQGIAYDSTNQRLFVSIEHEKRVLVFNVAPGTIQNGMDADYVIGEPNFTAVAGGCTRTTLGKIPSIAYDETTSRLFVSDATDTGYNRVMIYNATPANMQNGMEAENVLGQPDFTTCTASEEVVQNRLSKNSGLVYDQDSKYLFVADSANNRVVVFDANPATIQNGANAVNVLGQPNFTADVTGGSGAVTRNEFNWPYALAYDRTNHYLFLGDMHNNRILQFDLIRLTDSSLRGANVNESYFLTMATISSQSAVSFSLVSGSLPPGISLDTTNGVLLGTPTTTGSYSFSIEADDTSDTGKFFDVKAFLITVSEAFHAGPPVCSDPAPASTPLLTAETTGKASVLISFTRVNPATEYVLEYGTKSGEYQYSAVDINAESASYTVNLLAPNTTYYFRLRANNGCAAGAWSNEARATTGYLFQAFDEQTSDLNLPLPIPILVPDAVPIPTLPAPQGPINEKLGGLISVSGRRLWLIGGIILLAILRLIFLLFKRRHKKENKV